MKTQDFLVTSGRMMRYTDDTKNMAGGTSIGVLKHYINMVQNARVYFHTRNK